MARDLGIDLLMPRSTMPAIASMTTGANKLPVLLDADGLPNDERVEFQGTSPTSLSHRILRRLEAWSLRNADGITVRTRVAAKILEGRSGVPNERFHVVANARDARQFRPLLASERKGSRANLGLKDEPLLVYAGSSLSGKYLGRETLAFLREVRTRRPDARLLLLMPNVDEAQRLLEDDVELKSSCILRSAAPDEVPFWIGAADLGLALIKPTFSMQAASAIKIGEYLLCGIPVLATAGIGDSREVISSEVGQCLVDASQQSLSTAADWFVTRVLPNRHSFQARCRKVGLERFSLEIAVRGYEDALHAALARHHKSKGAGA